MSEKKEPLEVKVTNMVSGSDGTGCFGVILLYFVARNLWLIAERLLEIAELMK